MLEKVKAIVDKDLPLMTNLANVSAILNELPKINWCGFYVVSGDTLYLGPFQGDVACTTIKIGRGVCGSSFLKKETIIVPDVLKFPGHIACSTVSKSEIVVPIIKNDQVVGVIDIDAPIVDRFHQEEKDVLEAIAAYIKELF